jgi:hypothetical protein
VATAADSSAALAPGATCDSSAPVRIAIVVVVLTLSGRVWNAHGSRCGLYLG